SSALIQVVYPNAESAGLDTVSNGPDTVRGQSRLDESKIIMSERVIDMAIQLNDLTAHPKLSSMSAAALRRWIKSPAHLSVAPAGRDASTALIEIRFTGTDAEVCQVVVDAVIAGYDRYLTEAYRKLGNEVVEVVTKAQDQLQKKYEEIAKKNADFRQNAPLVWLGDEGNNHFSEHCIEIKKSINEIEIEDLKLQSLVSHIQAVEQNGRPVESILQMLSSDPQLNNILFRQKDSDLNANGTGGRSMGAATADRRAALVDLQIKEQELLNSVGEGHPAVASTRLRIELLNKQIAAMTDAEKHEININQVEQEDASTKLAFWKSAMQDRIAALKIQRASLQELADENERKSKELGEYLSQHSLLNKELASAQLLLDNYTNTLNRIQILPQGSQLTLQTLDPPALGEFVSPTLPPYLLGGGAGGFLLLAGLAILLDFADKNFRSPDDITKALGFPVLGHVPQMKAKVRKSLGAADATLCTLGGPNSFGSEAFRSIRTSLYFRESEAENRVIQITSPVPGDGKSTVATNLAVSIAQSGRTVLLIDADMRRPRISSLFGQHNELGLADLLRNKCELSDVMLDGPIRNLSLIASSIPAKDPAELLSGVAFSSLIEVLRSKFEYIIIDTPPLLAVSDAASVAARADAVLLTVRLRRNSRPLALQASQMLLDMGVRPMGIVVNGITNSRSYGYRYGEYGYQEAVVE
ncbi:MAG: polysaccharide biosynthesis tyrosine autokinase, partial [Pirellulaceae bacterium]|nr:polysaccharide biosynthesis tyrosine autokinase [Pirellulaceae bacterium]